MGNPVFNAKGDNLLYGGEVDVTVTPIDMPKGALYLYAPESGTPLMLTKLDDGVTSNFNEVPQVPLGSNVMINDFSNAVTSVVNIDMGGFNLLNVGSVDGTGSGLDLNDTLNIAATTPLVDFTGVTNFDLTGVNLVGVTLGDLWSDPVDSNILPTGADLTYSLGATGAQFTNLWAQTLSSDGNITLSPTGSILINNANMNFQNLNSIEGMQDILGDNVGIYSLTGVLYLESSAGNIELNPSGFIDASSSLISNVTDPVSLQDAATKNYVDTQVSGAADTQLSNLSAPTLVAVSLDPAAHNTYDLGNAGSTRGWRNLFVQSIIGSDPSGNLAIDAHVVPNVDAGKDLGSSSLNWREVFTRNITSSGANNMTIASGQAVLVNTAGNFQVNSDFSINLILDTASGAFRFLDSAAAAPSPGDVWTCIAADGEGYWATPAAAGANTALSNLASVAINADLVWGTATAANIQTFAEADNVATQNIVVKSGNATGANSGEANWYSGDVLDNGVDDNAGISGDINIWTGYNNNWSNNATTTITGDIHIHTGGIGGGGSTVTGTTGQVHIRTGGKGDNTEDNIFSGPITISTGSWLGWASNSGGSGAATFRSGHAEQFSQGFGATGDVTVQSGDNLATGFGGPGGNGSSGVVTIKSGLAYNDAGAAGGSGNVVVESGEAGGSGNTYPSGNVSIASGNMTGVAGGAGSGDVNISTGTSPQDSGDINLTTGTATNQRGIVSVDALAFKLPTSTTNPPTTLPDGSCYYNTSDDTIRVLRGGTWRATAALT